MKGLKKLALASAVLAVSTGAFAMEALQDDALSDTTGQAGLTITSSNTAVQAYAIRYFDSDGIGASTSGLIASQGTGSFLAGALYDEPTGPFAGSDPQSIITAFATDQGGSGGSINISGFSLTIGKTVTTIDVGTNTAGVSGLLVGMSAANLNTNLIINFDSGNETSLAKATADLSAPNIGGIAIENLTLPSTTLLITSGANDLTTYGGTSTTSGLTITPLATFNLSLTVQYYDTNDQTWTGSALAGATANKGVVSLPIYVVQALAGSTEIAAGNIGGSYAGGNGIGLEVLSGGLGANLVDIGGEGLGGTGILLAGSDAGSIGILGLKVAPSLMSISGH